jgi:Holliday junction resolvase
LSSPRENEVDIRMALGLARAFVRLVTQYARGRSKEYRTMEMLRGEGWVVARSAGSHGPVDVFAARAGIILLVQVKKGKARMKTEEAKELVKWAEAFNADAEIWHFKGRGNLMKRRVFARK